MFQKKFSVSVAVVAVALFLFFSPGFVFAQWNDCPKGEVNDLFRENAADILILTRMEFVTILNPLPKKDS